MKLSLFTFLDVRNERGSIPLFAILILTLVTVAGSAASFSKLVREQKRMAQLSKSRQIDQIRSDLELLANLSAVDSSYCRKQISNLLREGFSVGGQSFSPGKFERHEEAPAVRIQSISKAAFESKYAPICNSEGCSLDGYLAILPNQDGDGLMRNEVLSSKLVIKTNADREIISCSFEPWDLPHLCAELGGAFNPGQSPACQLNSLQDGQCPKSEAARGIRDEKIVCAPYALKKSKSVKQ